MEPFPVVQLVKCQLPPSPDMPLTYVKLAWLQVGHGWPQRYFREEGIIDAWLNGVIRAMNSTSWNEELCNVISMGSGQADPNDDMASPTISQDAVHQDAVSAAKAVMCGEERFIPNCGRRFVPDSAPERQRRWDLKFMVSTMYLEDGMAETPGEVFLAKRLLKISRTAVPRFLFRGFNPESGGGFDDRLNSKEGVTPHAFLNGEEPTNMWDIEDLSTMINLHLGGNASITSAFSSWTHSLGTALHFAGEGEGAMIAVLDTSSLTQHVYFSPDLARVGLCRDYFHDEYLIYGPVVGPHYHCIPVEELYGDNWWPEEISSGTRNRFGRERISSIERGAVDAAREQAKLLQPPGTGSENILILTAKFLGVRIAKIRPRKRYIRPRDMHGFLHYMRDDIQALALRSDATYMWLVEPTMDTTYRPDGCRCRGLEFEVQLQQVAENAVHAMGWQVRATIPRALPARLHNRLIRVPDYTDIDDLDPKPRIDESAKPEYDLADETDLKIDDGSEAVVDEAQDADEMDVDVVDDVDTDMADYGATDMSNDGDVSVVAVMDLD